MKTGLCCAVAGVLAAALILAGGCSHDEPQARRPISPFYASEAITAQALEQGVEYPYTAHLASMHNEPALRVMMRLRGLDEQAAEQHGAVLVNLVEIWGDKPFTAVLVNEDDDVQQYVTTLIREDLWRQYLATSESAPQTAAMPPAETIADAEASDDIDADAEPAETEAEAADAESGETESIDVVCTVDIGGRYGEADLVSLRERDEEAEAAKPAETQQCAVIDASADDEPTVVYCICPSEKKHRCPNAWCVAQHRFPCLHKLAMIRYGQYTAPQVAGIAQE